MTIEPQPAESGRLARKLTRIVLLSLVAALLALSVYKTFKPKNEFMGQKIIYRNEFKTAVEITPYGAGRVLWSECMKEPSSIFVTVDTVVFTTHYGTIGMKPIIVDENNALICKRADGEMVMLLRIKPYGVEDTPDNQILMIAQPEGSILLNPQAKCLTEEDLKK
jgi:hypothetical protein